MSGPERLFKNEDSRGLELTAWRNDKGNVSFKFRKSYKVKDSNPIEYKDTNYLFPNELVVLADLCAKAKAWYDTEGSSGTSTHDDAEATTTPAPVNFATDDVNF